MEYDLLIRVAPNTSLIKAVHVSRFQPGDVISAELSGHQWTARELTNPNWRIIRVTATLVEVESLLVPEQDAGGTKSLVWKRGRGNAINEVMASQLEKDFIRGERTHAIIPMERSDFVEVIKPPADSL